MTLLKAVVLGIYNFSHQTLFLPKLVVKEINGILKNFLWHEKCEKKGGAKVSWKEVNASKKEGGLDLKDIRRLE
ncbi:hypothetical protein LIER_41015 [Lithospermum erythrorhizon]|uniref:Uncharacterized protein n=1 Tax=Lithospermum erythrorhizon TaxID=34254 RepID=A0AAV3R6Y9_LITER